MPLGLFFPFLFPPIIEAALSRKRITKNGKSKIMKITNDEYDMLSSLQPFPKNRTNSLYFTKISF
jgi:hypothetical protein